MKTLYHGSYTEVSVPLAKAGRRNLDFGQGFYLTSIRQQAENWATIIASRKGRNVVGRVSVFQFDESRAIADGVRSSALILMISNGSTMWSIADKEKTSLRSMMPLKVA